jgi:hypothetical protein
MSYEENCRSRTVVPGSVVSRYRFVVLASDGQVDHVAAAGAMPDGVAMEPATAQQVPPAIPMALPDGGVVKVECGGNIAVGAAVESNGSGQAITFPATVGHTSCGRALEAGASGRIIAIQFFNNGANVGT